MLLLDDETITAVERSIENSIVWSFLNVGLYLNAIYKIQFEGVSGVTLIRRDATRLFRLDGNTSRHNYATALNSIRYRYTR